MRAKNKIFLYRAKRVLKKRIRCISTSPHTGPMFFCQKINLLPNQKWQSMFPQRIIAGNPDIFQDGVRKPKLLVGKSAPMAKIIMIMPPRHYVALLKLMHGGSQDHCSCFLRVSIDKCK